MNQKGLRQQIRFCASRDGTRIAYASVGQGPPLVRAPHWMTHLESDLESPVWGEWIAELARSHTLLRQDQRGCGLSDRDPADVSFDRLVEDLEAMVDAAGLERFGLLGISQGGPISVAYAARHPERVSHLVLCGAYACGRLVRAKTQAEIDEFEAIVRLVELGWGREDPSFRQLFSAQFMPDADAEHLRAFNELQRVSAEPAIVARLARSFARIDVRELASAIKAPTLVMHARNDLRIPFDEGRLLASLIPGAELVPLDGRSHILLPNEPAWRQFFAALDAFLPAVPAEEALGLLDALTPREREILDLVARGLDNPTIGERLALTEKTIRNNVSAIFSKLGVSSRAEAIVRAREAGFGGER